ncbi:MAG: PfkB family carbohydrate kinase [Synergistaceae bacterium]|jgi:1-phosphofructokinase family hexose kinase|nr:PfkB family carbohydrate kinase [Synergistaceae bacterium]
MLLTVTLNPAVDVDFIVSGLNPGGRYRADVSRRSPGGAGINVSIVLNRLGISSVAMGFLAGFNGQYILDALRREKVFSHFVHTRGETRINVCVIDPASGPNESETRLCEAGVEISEPDRRAFLRSYERILRRSGKVAIGGSLPPGIDSSFCVSLVRSAKNNSIPAILYPGERDLDANPDILLEEAPAIVQLSSREIRRKTDFTRDEIDAFMSRAGTLRRGGTEWIVMPLCRGKVIFASQKGAWIAESPPEEMAYMYAADNALLAGLIAATEEDAPPEAMMRFSTACYWECATHPGKFPGDRACVENLTSRVRLVKID